jgi:hypothetical protein
VRLASLYYYCPASGRAVALTEKHDSLADLSGGQGS